MGLSLVLNSPLDSVTEPVSVTDAKAHLRVTISSDDTLIGKYLLAARRHAESYIRGAIVQQSWDYSIDGRWPFICADGKYRNRIELPLHPVASVTSVSYVDTSGVTQTLSPSLYTVHLDGTVPYIEKAYDATWPDVRDVPEAIIVRFVAGYDSVPEEIRTAILLHTEILYDRNSNEKALLEQSRDALLDPYRVLRVG